MPILTHDWFAAAPIDRDRLWRRTLFRVVPLLLALCVPRAALADPTTFDYSGTLSEIFPLGSVTIDDERQN